MDMHTAKTPAPGSAEGFTGRAPRRSFLARFRALIVQFKRDLREPLAEAEGKPRLQRIRIRFRFLFKRYGWKLAIAVFTYYLVRDTILYIIIPYFVARQLLS